MLPPSLETFHRPPLYIFFFSSRRRHTRYWRDWSSDVCSSDLTPPVAGGRSRVRPLSAHRGVAKSDGGPAPARRRSLQRARDTRPWSPAWSTRRRSEERRVGKEWRSRWAPYH